MVTRPLISGLMYQNSPRIHHNPLLRPIRMLGGESGGNFKTALTAAAAKVKACHYPLQMSDVIIQVYPPFQSMQVKVLPIKF